MGSSSVSGPVGLDRVTQTGWRSGLPSLMAAGFGSWWKTRTWWIQSLIWIAVLNGSLAALIWGDAPDRQAIFTVFGVMTTFAAIAVTIIMQEAIVGEKRSGTAAWVLSKPASRTAFVLSKLVPNSVGVLATMILIPSSVLLVQLALAGIDVDLGPFALGAAVAGLNLLFYLTLSLMLGTLFDSAGPVIAIPLAFAFGQQLLGGLPHHRVPAVVPAGAHRGVRYERDRRHHRRPADPDVRGDRVHGHGVRHLHDRRVLAIRAHRALEAGQDASARPAEAWDRGRRTPAADHRVVRKSGITPRT